MKAVFVELPAFDRHRAEYLGDEAFRMLQTTFMRSPNAGAAIEGTGGLRLRFADVRSGKGKRGSLRVIYFWWKADSVLALTPFTTKMNGTICPDNSAKR